MKAVFNQAGQLIPITRFSTSLQRMYAIRLLLLFLKLFAQRTRIALCGSNPTNKSFLSLKYRCLYDEISMDEYHRIQHKCGKSTPNMWILTIKYKNGYQDRAKSRIVVLGNQQQQNYSKSENTLLWLPKINFDVCYH